MCIELLLVDVDDDALSAADANEKGWEEARVDLVAHCCSIILRDC